ncbi:hypothetical protein [Candidatus Symbiothrix dinenymphae]|uniref:hypothetical protein n=1 Tax=Candidatus Symbiothrix dinenymphae TaxID=467085 RepID=UPI0006E1EC2E|nr:hypothetical protein [Candidatus Symbiothrix dinenymphae]
MSKIKIGADELILWLRKNEKAKDIPNAGSGGLGQKIFDLLVTTIGGKKIIDDNPAYWANLKDDKIISQYNLPQKSAQYEVESSELGRIYNTLILW